MLPPRIRRSARARLTLVSLSDDGTRPLSDKLLARTAALERIRRAIPDPDRAYLLAHNSTALERDLALALDIPIYGPDPAHRGLGTKSGSRELFALSGVPLELNASSSRAVTTRPKRGYAVRSIEVTAPSLPRRGEPISARGYCRFPAYPGWTLFRRVIGWSVVLMLLMAVLVLLQSTGALSWMVV
jgi:hypothetical protein